MVLTVTWNGTSYSIPQSGERGWSSLTTFLQALATSAQSVGKQIVGRRTATATPVTVTATTDAYVGINVAAATAVNLPAGVNGQMFIIADESDLANTNNITINPNGSNTINSTTSFVMSRDSQAVILIFSGSDWVVVANASPSNPIVSATDSAEIDFTVSSAGALTGSLIAASVARSKLAVGTADHVLINNGAGAMSSEAQLAGTRGGTGASNAGVLSYGANNVTLTTSGATTLTVPLTGTVATLAGTEELSNKTFTNATVMKTANELRFNNAGDTFYTGIKGGNAASSGTFLLPITDGTASQVMTTDGSRQLGWATVATTVGAVGAQDSNVTFTTSNNRSQIVLPTAARTYTLPTTSIVSGDTWEFQNRSAFSITLNSSGGNLVTYIPAYSNVAVFALQNAPTTAAHWAVRGINPIHIPGAITGTAPAAGYLGEELIGTQSTSTNTAATVTYGDVTSVSLTAGVWDVSGNFELNANSATITDLWIIAITSTAGNFSTGQTYGLNRSFVTAPSGAAYSTYVIPKFRVLLSSTTTYYLKVLAQFSAGQPKAAGSIRATRVG